MENSFYFNDNEIKSLIEFIYLIDGKLVPDILYKDAKYKIIKDYREFYTILKDQTVHFFLIDKSFMIEDLNVTENPYILAGNNYSINQREGGPYIDLLFYRGFSEESTIKYKRSVISVYSKFVHSNSNKEFKAPFLLINYYKQILNYIKGKSKRVKVNNKIYTIGLEVLDETDLLKSAE